MHRPTTRATLALLALLLVGCSGGANPTPTPAPSATPTAEPSAAVAVIHIEQTGGMMPPWETMRRYPTVALYGDGRLIAPGPQIELYPGPALPNLLVTHYSQHAVDQAIAWAAEAGLQGEDRQLGPLLLDAGVMLFTVVTPAGTHHTSVSDLSADDPQIAALREFQDVMSNLRSWLPDDIAGDETAYPWDRLRVIAFPSDPASLPDPNLSSTVDWPLTSLASLGASWSEPASYRCFELSRTDLATARSLFEQVNELTLYRSEGVLYQLYLHPLLPDDEACPGL